MYGSEWCMKGIITSRARKVWWRRCTLARVSDAPVALEPAGTGAVKAARSPRGGSIESTSGALKQYEYPICEITKTGLLPPGVINTGEFVHHRACGVWAGGRRDAPLFYRCLSLANWLSRRYADVPGVTAWLRARRTAHASCTATSPASPAARCQPLASQIEASAGESGCVRSRRPANQPCSGRARASANQAL